MSKLHIKKGDTVKVTTGNSKGQEGKVIEVITDKSRAFVALNRRFYDSTLDLKNRIKKNKGNRIIEVLILKIKINLKS